MQTAFEGYDCDEEDQLLESIDWHEDGYRLFDISVFAGSSKDGWFNEISESHALFMRKEVWQELGGFDEGFSLRGGGLANSDLLSRAIALPNVQVMTLLGEGTFRQVRGGFDMEEFCRLEHLHAEEYERLRGSPHQQPRYTSFYLGCVPDAVHASVVRSLRPSMAPPARRHDPGDRHDVAVPWHVAHADPPVRSPPEALIVLGMHRSGTSALAGVLCKLGFVLPGAPIPLAPDNPKGHFESAWVKNLNERILRRLGTSWDDPLPGSFDWKAMRIDDLLSEVQSNLVDAFEAAPFLLVKDPRLCLSAPIWFDAFARAKRRIACVISTRHPFDVARSLQARDGFPLSRGLGMWLKYVLAAEHSTRGTRRCIITYPQLLGDCVQTLQTIETELGMTWPADSSAIRDDITSFLEPELCHHTESTPHEDLQIAALCEETWDLICALATNPGDAPLMKGLDVISERFRESAALLSSLFDVQRPPVEPAHAPHLDGQRVRVPDHPEVWLIFHGLRHHVTTSSVYESLFGDVTDLMAMPTVAHITRGPDLVEGASLIRGVGRPDIFLLNGHPRDGLRKHRIKSFACFKAFGFNPEKVRDLPAIVVDAILEGRSIG